MPSLDKAIYAGVVENEGKVIGFGQTRLTTESLMIIDQSLPLKKKVEILKLIMEAQLVGMAKAGYDETHAFAQNPNFSSILKKHFGYEDVKGDTLVLRVQNAKVSRG